jgi:hypothetical protein
VNKPETASTLGGSALKTAGRVYAAHDRRSRSQCPHRRTAPLPPQQGQPTVSGESSPPRLAGVRYASEKPYRRWHRRRVLARQREVGRTPRQPHGWPQGALPTPHEYWSIDLSRSRSFTSLDSSRFVDPNRRARQGMVPGRHRPRLHGGRELSSRNPAKPPAFARDPVETCAPIQAIR